METSLTEIQKLSEEYFQRRAEADEIKERLREVNLQVEELENTILSVLEAHDLSKFDSQSGSLSVSSELTVTVPQGDEKLKFFEYLKSKGEFEALATVNYQTLNGYVRKELEQNPLAVIPGVGMPKEYKRIKARRKK